jgi:hypothetical protein
MKLERDALRDRESFRYVYGFWRLSTIERLSLLSEKKKDGGVVVSERSTMEHLGSRGDCWEYAGLYDNHGVGCLIQPRPTLSVATPALRRILLP